VPVVSAKTTALGDGETNVALGQVMKTKSFRSVRKKLQNDGFKMQPADARAVELVNAQTGDSGTRVHVPFTTSGDERATAFAFDDGESVRTVAAVYRDDQLTQRLYANPGTSSASDVASWKHTDIESLDEKVSPREYQKAASGRARTSAIPIPGYNHVGTYSLDDICFVVGGSCFGLFLASLANLIPGDEAFVGTACGIAGGGCFIKDAAKRYANCSDPSIVLYGRAWWNPVGPVYIGYPTC
jgi:hypothetical protein